MEYDFEQRHHSFESKCLESKCYDWFIGTLGACAPLATRMLSSDETELECPLVGRYT